MSTSGVFSTPGDTISTSVDIMIASVRPSIDLHFKPSSLTKKVSFFGIRRLRKSCQHFNHILFSVYIWH